MSSQIFSPYTASGPSDAGDLNDVLATLAERPTPVFWVPIALAFFTLLAGTVLVTNTGEKFSLDE